MRHENLLSNSVVTVASILPDVAKLSAAASLGINIVVQPAIWLGQGSVPDAVDVGLWGGGVASAAFSNPITGLACGLTSVWKGYVTDEVRRLRDHAKSSEPRKVQPYINACYEYPGAISGPGITAMTIAIRGGTAWEHPNGV